ncbi:SpoIIE family protein phosphatase [Candidatus Micrarchaeota archaeon]|nr:SpoIIE family protein phosphatase [Candidatus Micrarchaeota archaeon]MBU1682190.1 SpoIIE family protein phosphatase [Candidatus Micrarchaeota archaeon]
MEKLLLGIKINASEYFDGKTSFCEFSSIVKRVHEECGDSAVVYADEKLLIAAVFDGVSGESGAANASSAAASSILEFLKTKAPSEKAVHDAISHANKNITQGYTTASIFMANSTGSFVMACVGDSPIYGMIGETLDLEIPLGRPVGDNDSILKFISHRSLVTSVIGPSGVDVEIRMTSGKLKGGELIILASDALIDNLYLKIKEGYITDSSGSEDLKELITGLKDPKEITKTLAAEIEQRSKGRKIEKPDKLLDPKRDDISIITLRFI